MIKKRFYKVGAYVIMGFDHIIFNLAQGYYRYIGSGSSRRVFDLGNGYVIKVAKNKAGVAQNKCEYRISINDTSNLFAKVAQVSDDYTLLIMEKAIKVKNISNIWNYFNVSGKNEFINLKRIQEMRRNYNLLLGDLARESNWGIINGKPVIIDYGFTRAVRARYYRA